jgi:predicted RNA-binding protein with PUA-like domain
MRHWLMKTEPSTFGLETLAAAPRRTTGWDGVRNYQVRNMIRDEMKKGDLAFLYHSSCVLPGIVATMKIVSAGYPDPTAFDRKDDHYDPDSDPADPRWYMVDVQLQKALARPVALEELRAHAHTELKDMVLLRPGNRLSITPVAAAHWTFILALV